MKRTITITDLTRMYGGYVCVAGQAEDGEWVRLSAPRPHELEVVVDGRGVLCPMSVVECNVLRHEPEPPHTEDYRYDPASILWLRRLPVEDWRKVLAGACFESAAEIFEQPINDDHGHYILDGSGPRSLGSLKPAAIHRVSYGPGAEGNWDYRLSFSDGTGARYALKITDYTWHRYCDARRERGEEPGTIASALTTSLRGREVFLRLGLSRKWAKFPGRCYLQINGVHTFPDYLEGRTIAEL
jgi:hypothetical protein